MSFKWKLFLENSSYAEKKNENTRGATWRWLVVASDCGEGDYVGRKWMKQVHSVCLEGKKNTPDVADM